MATTEEALAAASAQILEEMDSRLATMETVLTAAAASAATAAAQASAQSVASQAAAQISASVNVQLAQQQASMTQALTQAIADAAANAATAAQQAAVSTAQAAAAQTAQSIAAASAAGVENTVNAQLSTLNNEISAQMIALIAQNTQVINDATAQFELLESAVSTQLDRIAEVEDMEADISIGVWDFIKKWLHKKLGDTPTPHYVTRKLALLLGKLLKKETQERVEADAALQGNIDAEAAARTDGDADTLQEAKDYADDLALTTQTWLPAVQTFALLPTVPDAAKTYLCRVIADATATNNGVWQWIGGGTAWTYFSDNSDFVDDTELASGITAHNTSTSAHQDIRDLIAEAGGSDGGGVSQAALDAEVVARAAADTALQSNIYAEAVARAAADTTLQEAIEGLNEAKPDRSELPAVLTDLTISAAADATNSYFIRTLVFDVYNALIKTSSQITRTIPMAQYMLPGIVRGSITGNGKIAVANDGTMQVIGWSELGNGNISIKINNETKTFNVNQGNDVTLEFVGNLLKDMVISPNSCNLGASGGSTNIIGINLMSYKWSVKESPEWSLYSPLEGNGNASLNIGCQNNTSPSPRTGVIVFEDVLGRQVTFTINQAGAS